MKTSNLLFSTSALAALLYLLLLVWNSIGVVGTWATGPVTIMFALAGIIGPLCFALVERSRENKQAKKGK